MVAQTTLIFRYTCFACLVQVSKFSRSLWSLSAVRRCRLWITLPQESVYVVDTLQGPVSRSDPAYDSPSLVETV